MGPEQTPVLPRATAIAIALVAGAIMVFEIALIRIFSFAIWHHFAFMVLSIALLGFAVSGVLLQRRPALGQPPRSRAALYALLFGVTGAVLITAVTRVPFDATRLDLGELAYLLIYYAALVVPFAFAGLAIVTLLDGYTAAVGRLYASDLVGAAIGCFVAVASMAWFGGEGAVALAAAMAVTAGWLLVGFDLEMNGKAPARLG